MFHVCGIGSNELPHTTLQGRLYHAHWITFFPHLPHHHNRKSGGVPQYPRRLQECNFVDTDEEERERESVDVKTTSVGKQPYHSPSLLHSLCLPPSFPASLPCLSPPFIIRGVPGGGGRDSRRAEHRSPHRN